MLQADSFPIQTGRSLLYQRIPLPLPAPLPDMPPLHGGFFSPRRPTGASAVPRPSHLFPLSCPLPPRQVQDGKAIRIRGRAVRLSVSPPIQKLVLPWKSDFGKASSFCLPPLFSPLPTLVPEAVPPPFVSPRIFRPNVPLLFSQSHRNGKDSDTAPISPSFQSVLSAPVFLFQKAQELAPSLPLPFLLQADRRLLFPMFPPQCAAAFLHLPLQTTLLSPTGRHESFLYARAALPFLSSFLPSASMPFPPFPDGEKRHEAHSPHHRRVKKPAALCPPA